MQLYQPNNQSTVSFSASFGKDFKLIEVSEEVLKLVDAGEDLSIIGNESDAVLCSKDRTYGIKRVEYSNSVYFVPPSSNCNFTIESTCTDYYEIKPIVGKLDVIDILLSETEYKGAVYEAENPPNQDKLIKKSNLFQLVQASPTEINCYLDKLNIIEIDGFIRLLSKNTIQETIRMLFLTILTENLKMDSIDESLILNLMNDREASVLTHVLQMLGKKVDNGWQLSLNEVLKASAHLIFQNSEDKKIATTAFFHEWFQQTPGFSNESLLDEILLKGIAIKEENIVGKTSTTLFRYLPVSDLSRDPKIRFKQLFEVKSKFSLEDLEPYLLDLIGGVGQPKSIAELLLMYTNCVGGSYMLK